MDATDLDRARHREALLALGRINRVSLGARRLFAEVRRLHRAGASPVRVLDVACGGGDVLAALGRWARRVRVPVELHGCDRSPVALDHARELCGRVGGGLTSYELDVLRDPLPTGYDLVCSSLFLHHLAEAEAVTLLKGMAAASRWSLLVQDLRRTRLGYALAWIGLHALTRSDVARVDGLLSVRAAYTLTEAEALCRRAGLEGAEVRPCWPERFLLTWRRA